MSKELFKLTKEQVREAGSYAYEIIRPLRFLKEIDTPNRSELHLFGKWEDTDPDIVDIISVNGETKKLTVKPLDSIIIDKENKIIYSAASNTFPLLVQNKWRSFSNLKYEVNQRISEYVKAKWLNGNSVGNHNNKLIAVESNKVMGGRFNHSLPVLRRIFGGKLWKRLDPEICSLAIKIGGNKVTSLDYNIIWNNLEEVKDTMQKAPGILPIWINLCKYKIIKRKEFLSKDDFPFVSDDETHISINQNMKFPNIIKTVKLMLENQNKPLSSMGWKYLIKLKPAWTRKICASTVSGTNRAFEIFAKANVIPRLTVTKHLAKITTNFWWKEFDHITEAFIKVVCKHTDKMIGIKHFWDAEGSLVFDWLTDAMTNRNNIPEKQQLKAPWTWWMRKQAEWHEAILQNKRKNIKQEIWNCAITTFTHKNFVIVPITNSLDLFNEGKEMHHCVHSYTKDCLLGKSRIFSIKIGDMKVATAEIVKNTHDQWSFGQIRGKCNSKVPTNVENIVKIIVTKYNQALKKETNNDQEIFAKAV